MEFVQFELSLSGEVCTERKHGVEGRVNGCMTYKICLKKKGLGLRFRRKLGNKEPRKLKSFRIN